MDINQIGATSTGTNSLLDQTETEVELINFDNKKLSFLGICLLLLVAYSLTKSTTGYNIVYYTILITLLLLVLGNYKKINNIMYK